MRLPRASGAEAIALFAEGREVVIPGQAAREGELAVDNSFAGEHAIRICPGCRLPGKHFRTDLDGGVMSYLNRRRRLATCGVVADFNFVFAGSAPVFFNHALGFFGVFFTD